MPEQLDPLNPLNPLNTQTFTVQARPGLQPFRDMEPDDPMLRSQQLPSATQPAASAVDDHPFDFSSVSPETEPVNRDGSPLTPFQRHLVNWSDPAPKALELPDASADFLEADLDASGAAAVRRGLDRSSVLAVNVFGRQFSRADLEADDEGRKLLGLMQDQRSGAQPGFFAALGHFSKSDIPYYGWMTDIGTSAGEAIDISKAMKKLQNGDPVTNHEAIAVRRFMLQQEVESTRSLGYNVGALIHGSVPFFAEMFLDAKIGAAIGGAIGAGAGSAVGPVGTGVGGGAGAAVGGVVGALTGLVKGVAKAVARGVARAAGKKILEEAAGETAKKYVTSFVSKDMMNLAAKSSVKGFAGFSGAEARSVLKGVQAAAASVGDDADAVRAVVTSARAAARESVGARLAREALEKAGQKTDHMTATDLATYAANHGLDRGSAFRKLVTDDTTSKLLASYSNVVVPKMDAGLATVLLTPGDLANTIRTGYMNALANKALSKVVKEGDQFTGLTGYFGRQKAIAQGMKSLTKDEIAGVRSTFIDSMLKTTERNLGVKPVAAIQGGIADVMNLAPTSRVSLKYSRSVVDSLIDDAQRSFNLMYTGNGFVNGPARFGRWFLEHTKDGILRWDTNFFGGAGTIGRDGSAILGGKMAELKEGLGVALVEAPVRGMMQLAIQAPIYPLTSLALGEGANGFVLRGQLGMQAAALRTGDRDMMNDAHAVSMGMTAMEFISENAGRGLNMMGHAAIRPLLNSAADTTARWILPESTKGWGDFFSKKLTALYGPDTLMLASHHKQLVDAVSSEVRRLGAEAIRKGAAKTAAPVMASDIENLIAQRTLDHIGPGLKSLLDANHLSANGLIRQSAARSLGLTKARAGILYMTADWMLRKGVTAQKAHQLINRIGYDGIIGEMAEERYSDFFDGLFGWDESPSKATWKDHIGNAVQGLFPDPKQLLTEALGFAFPAVMQASCAAMQRSLGSSSGGIREIHDAAGRLGRVGSLKGHPVLVFQSGSAEEAEAVRGYHEKIRQDLETRLGTTEGNQAAETGNLAAVSASVADGTFDQKLRAALPKNAAPAAVDAASGVVRLVKENAVKDPEAAKSILRQLADNIVHSSGTADELASRLNDSGAEFIFGKAGVEAIRREWRKASGHRFTAGDDIEKSMLEHENLVHSLAPSVTGVAAAGTISGGTVSVPVVNGRNTSGTAEQESRAEGETSVDAAGHEGTPGAVVDQYGADLAAQTADDIALLGRSLYLIKHNGAQEQSLGRRVLSRAVGIINAITTGDVSLATTNPVAWALSDVHRPEQLSRFAMDAYERSVISGYRKTMDKNGKDVSAMTDVDIKSAIRKAGNQSIAKYAAEGQDEFHANMADLANLYLTSSGVLNIGADDIRNQALRLVAARYDRSRSGVAGFVAGDKTVASPDDPAFLSAHADEIAAAHRDIMDTLVQMSVDQSLAYTTHGKRGSDFGSTEIVLDLGAARRSAQAASNALKTAAKYGTPDEIVAAIGRLPAFRRVSNAVDISMGAETFHSIADSDLFGRSVDLGAVLAIDPEADIPVEQLQMLMSAMGRNYAMSPNEAENQDAAKAFVRRVKILANSMGLSYIDAKGNVRARARVVFSRGKDGSGTSSLVATRLNEDGSVVRGADGAPVTVSAPTREALTGMLKGEGLEPTETKLVVSPTREIVSSDALSLMMFVFGDNRDAARAAILRRLGLNGKTAPDERVFPPYLRRTVAADGSSKFMFDDTDAGRVAAQEATNAEMEAARKFAASGFDAKLDPAGAEAYSFVYGSKADSKGARTSLGYESAADAFLLSIGARRSVQELADSATSALGRNGAYSFRADSYTVPDSGRIIVASDYSANSGAEAMLRETIANTLGGYVSATDGRTVPVLRAAVVAFRDAAKRLIADGSIPARLRGQITDAIGEFDNGGNSDVVTYHQIAAVAASVGMFSCEREAVSGQGNGFFASPAMARIADEMRVSPVVTPFLSVVDEAFGGSGFYSGNASAGAGLGAMFRAFAPSVEELRLARSSSVFGDTGEGSVKLAPFVPAELRIDPGSDKTAIDDGSALRLVARGTNIGFDQYADMDKRERMDSFTGDVFSYARELAARGQRLADAYNAAHKGEAPLDSVRAYEMLVRASFGGGDTASGTRASIAEAGADVMPGAESAIPEIDDSGRGLEAAAERLSSESGTSVKFTMSSLSPEASRHIGEVCSAFMVTVDQKGRKTAEPEALRRFLLSRGLSSDEAAQVMESYRKDVGWNQLSGLYDERLDDDDADTSAAVTADTGSAESHDADARAKAFVSNKDLVAFGRHAAFLFPLERQNYTAILQRVRDTMSRLCPELSTGSTRGVPADVVELARELNVMFLPRGKEGLVGVLARNQRVLADDTLLGKALEETVSYLHDHNADADAYVFAALRAIPAARGRRLAVFAGLSQVANQAAVYLDDVDPFAKDPSTRFSVAPRGSYLDAPLSAVRAAYSQMAVSSKLLRSGGGYVSADEAERRVKALSTFIYRGTVEPGMETVLRAEAFEAMLSPAVVDAGDAKQYCGTGSSKVYLPARFAESVSVLRTLARERKEIPPGNQVHADAVRIARVITDRMTAVSRAIAAEFGSENELCYALSAPANRLQILQMLESGDAKTLDSVFSICNAMTALRGNGAPQGSYNTFFLSNFVSSLLGTAYSRARDRVTAKGTLTYDGVLAEINRLALAKSRFDAMTAMKDRSRWVVRPDAAALSTLSKVLRMYEAGMPRSVDALSGTSNGADSSDSSTLAPASTLPGFDRLCDTLFKELKIEDGTEGGEPNVVSVRDAIANNHGRYPDGSLPVAVVLGGREHNGELIDRIRLSSAVLEATRADYVVRHDNRTVRVPFYHADRNQIIVVQLPAAVVSAWVNARGEDLGIHKGMTLDDAVRGDIYDSILRDVASAMGIDRITPKRIPVICSQGVKTAMYSDVPGPDGKTGYFTVDDPKHEHPLANGFTVVTMLGRGGANMMLGSIPIEGYNAQAAGGRLTSSDALLAKFHTISGVTAGFMKGLCLRARLGIHDDDPVSPNACVEEVRREGRRVIERILHMDTASDYGKGCLDVVPALPAGASKEEAAKHDEAVARHDRAAAAADAFLASNTISVTDLEAHKSGAMSSQCGVAVVDGKVAVDGVVLLEQDKDGNWKKSEALAKAKWFTTDFEVKDNRVAVPWALSAYLAATGKKSLSAEEAQELHAPWVNDLQPGSRLMTKPARSVTGTNISSYEPATSLGHRLSNLAPVSGGLKFDGNTYSSAEAAYQAVKDGSRLRDRQLLVRTMADVLKAKLQQDKKLLDDVTAAGGIDFLRASRHVLRKPRGKNETTLVKYDRWQGRDGLFMKALRKAYCELTDEVDADPVVVEDKALRESRIFDRMGAADGTGESISVDIEDSTDGDKFAAVRYFTRDFFTQNVANVANDARLSFKHPLGRNDVRDILHNSAMVISALHGSWDEWQAPKVLSFWRDVNFLLTSEADDLVRTIIDQDPEFAEQYRRAPHDLQVLAELDRKIHTVFGSAASMPSYSSHGGLHPSYGKVVDADPYTHRARIEWAPGVDQFTKDSLRPAVVYGAAQRAAFGQDISYASGLVNVSGAPGFRYGLYLDEKKFHDAFMSDGDSASSAQTYYGRAKSDTDRAKLEAALATGNGDGHAEALRVLTLKNVLMAVVSAGASAGGKDLRAKFLSCCTDYFGVPVAGEGSNADHAAMAMRYSFDDLVLPDGRFDYAAVGAGPAETGRRTGRDGNAHIFVGGSFFTANRRPSGNCEANSGVVRAAAPVYYSRANGSPVDQSVYVLDPVTVHNQGSDADGDTASVLAAYGNGRAIPRRVLDAVWSVLGASAERRASVEDPANAGLNDAEKEKILGILSDAGFISAREVAGVAARHLSSAAIAAFANTFFQLQVDVYRRMPTVHQGWVPADVRSSAWYKKAAKGGDFAPGSAFADAKQADDGLSLYNIGFAGRHPVGVDVVFSRPLASDRSSVALYREIVGKAPKAGLSFTKAFSDVVKACSRDDGTVDIVDPWGAVKVSEAGKDGADARATSVFYQAVYQVMSAVAAEARGSGRQICNGAVDMLVPSADGYSNAKDFIAHLDGISNSLFDVMKNLSAMRAGWTHGDLGYLFARLGGAARRSFAEDPSVRFDDAWFFRELAGYTRDFYRPGTTENILSGVSDPLNPGFAKAYATQLLARSATSPSILGEAAAMFAKAVPASGLRFGTDKSTGAPMVYRKGGSADVASLIRNFRGGDEAFARNLLSVAAAIVDADPSSFAGKAVSAVLGDVPTEEYRSHADPVTVSAVLAVMAVNPNARGARKAVEAAADAAGDMRALSAIVDAESIIETDKLIQGDDGRYERTDSELTGEAAEKAGLVGDPFVDAMRGARIYSSLASRYGTYSARQDSAAITSGHRALGEIVKGSATEDDFAQVHGAFIDGTSSVASAADIRATAIAARCALGTFASNLLVTRNRAIMQHLVGAVADLDDTTRGMLDAVSAASVAGGTSGNQQFRRAVAGMFAGMFVKMAKDGRIDELGTSGAEAVARNADVEALLYTLLIDKDHGTIRLAQTLSGPDVESARRGLDALEAVTTPVAHVDVDANGFISAGLAGEQSSEGASRFDLTGRQLVSLLVLHAAMSQSLSAAYDSRVASNFSSLLGPERLFRLSRLGEFASAHPALRELCCVRGDRTDTSYPLFAQAVDTEVSEAGNAVRIPSASAYAEVNSTVAELASRLGGIQQGEARLPKDSPITPFAAISAVIRDATGFVAHYSDASRHAALAAKTPLANEWSTVPASVPATEIRREDPSPDKSGESFVFSISAGPAVAPSKYTGFVGLSSATQFKTATRKQSARFGLITRSSVGQVFRVPGDKSGAAFDTVEGAVNEWIHGRFRALKENEVLYRSGDKTASERIHQIFDAVASSPDARESLFWPPAGARMGDPVLRLFNARDAVLRIVESAAGLPDERDIRAAMKSGKSAVEEVAKLRADAKAAGDEGFADLLRSVPQDRAVSVSAEHDDPVGAALTAVSRRLVSADLAGGMSDSGSILVRKSAAVRASIGIPGGGVRAASSSFVRGDYYAALLKKGKELAAGVVGGPMASARAALEAEFGKWDGKNTGVEVKTVRTAAGVETNMLRVDRHVTADTVTKDGEIVPAQPHVVTTYISFGDDMDADLASDEFAGSAVSSINARLSPDNPMSVREYLSLTKSQRSLLLGALGFKVQGTSQTDVRERLRKTAKLDTDGLALMSGLIRLSQDATYFTLFHEYFHQMLAVYGALGVCTDEDRAALTKQYHWADGTFNEEAAANAFARYVAGDRSSSAQLRNGTAKQFEKFRHTAEALLTSTLAYTSDGNEPVFMKVVVTGKLDLDASEARLMEAGAVKATESAVKEVESMFLGGRGAFSVTSTAGMHLTPAEISAREESRQKIFDALSLDPASRHDAIQDAIAESALVSAWATANKTPAPEEKPADKAPEKSPEPPSDDSCARVTKFVSDALARFKDAGGAYALEQGMLARSVRLSKLLGIYEVDGTMESVLLAGARRLARETAEHLGIEVDRVDEHGRVVLTPAGKSLLSDDRVTELCLRLIHASDVEKLSVRGPRAAHASADYTFAGALKGISPTAYLTYASDAVNRAAAQFRDAAAVLDRRAGTDPSKAGDLRASAEAMRRLALNAPTIINAIARGEDLHGLIPNMKDVPGNLHGQAFAHLTDGAVPVRQLDGTIRYKPNQSGRSRLDYDGERAQRGYDELARAMFVAEAARSFVYENGIDHAKDPEVPVPPASDAAPAAEPGIQADVTPQFILQSPGAWLAGDLARDFYGTSLRDIMTDHRIKSATEDANRLAMEISVVFGQTCCLGESPFALVRKTSRLGKDASGVFRVDDKNAHSALSFETVRAIPGTFGAIAVSGKRQGAKFTADNFVEVNWALQTLSAFANHDTRFLTGVDVPFIDKKDIDSLLREKDAASVLISKGHRFSVDEVTRRVRRADGAEAPTELDMALYRVITDIPASIARPEAADGIYCRLLNAAIATVTARGDLRREKLLSELRKSGEGIVEEAADGSGRAVIAIPLQEIRDWWNGCATHKALVESSGRTEGMLNLDYWAFRVAAAANALHDTARGSKYLKDGMGGSMTSAAATGLWFQEGSGHHSANAKRYELASSVFRDRVPSPDNVLRSKYLALYEIIERHQHPSKDGTRTGDLPAFVRPGEDGKHVNNISDTQVQYLMHLLGFARNTVSVAKFSNDVLDGVYARGRAIPGVDLSPTMTVFDMDRAIHDLVSINIIKSIDGKGGTFDAGSESSLVDLKAVNDLVEDAIGHQAGGRVNSLSEQAMFRATGKLGSTLTAPEVLQRMAESIVTAHRFRGALAQMLTTVADDGAPNYVVSPDAFAAESNEIPDEYWGALARFTIDRLNASRRMTGKLSYDAGKSGTDNMRRVYHVVRASALVSVAKGHVSGTYHSLEPISVNASPLFDGILCHADDETGGGTESSVASNMFGNNGEAESYLRQLFALRRAPSVSGTWRGLDRIMAYSKAMSVSLSAFFGLATRIESPIAATGFFNTMLGFTDFTANGARRIGRALGRTGGTSAFNADATFLKDYLNTFMSDDPSMRDIREMCDLVNMPLGTLSTGSLEMNPMSEKLQTIDGDINRMCAFMTRNGMSAMQVRMMRRTLRGALHNPTEYAFTYVLNGVKMAVVAQTLRRLRSECEHSNRPFDPVAELRRYSDYVNAEIGGIDQGRYAWLTPQMRLMLRLLMFSYQWTMGAWVAGGGEVVSDLLFGGHSTTVASRRFSAVRWLRMIGIVKVGIPLGLQAMIKALATAINHGQPPDDPDQPDERQMPWLCFNNEARIGALCFDVTPLLQLAGKVPGTKELKRSNVPFISALVPAYVGGGANSTGRRRYYMHFGKQSDEFFRWFTDGWSQLTSKLSLPLQKSFEGFFGSMSGQSFAMKFTDKPFADRFLTLSLDPNESAWANMMTSFIPFSSASVMTHPDTGVLGALGPVQMGVSTTETQKKILRALREFAEDDRHTDPWAYPRNHKKLVTLCQDIVRDARLNGVDTDNALSSALGQLSTIEYRELFEALPKAADGAVDVPRMTRALRALYRINRSNSKIVRAMKARYEKEGLAWSAHPELRAAVMSLTRGTARNPYGYSADEAKQTLAGIDKYFSPGTAESVRATGVQQDAKGGVAFRNFLATDRVPDTLFGIPVVSGAKDLTDEDREFFRMNPKAAGYYDMGDSLPPRKRPQGVPEEEPEEDNEEEKDNG